VRIRSRRPITAAIVATYFSGKLTGKKTFVGIRRRVLRVRRLYVDRLWQLGRHALWLYQRGLSPRADEVEVERLVRAFRLAANCTPRSVIYSRPRTWAKACNRANFCPYCWEATSARQFQRIREIVNKILSVSSRQSFIAEYRVVERFVSARGIGGMHFVSEQERFAAIETLRAEIALTKQYISQQHKQFQRRTVGSIWRIVIIPHEIGWKLQLRQFWIAAADANFVAHPPPAGATIPRARTLNLQPGATWRQRKTTHSVDHHIYQIRTRLRG
jgi:hypothetical protein